jgi:hypothetical protein
VRAAEMVRRPGAFVHPPPRRVPGSQFQLAFPQRGPAPSCLPTREAHPPRSPRSNPALSCGPHSRMMLVAKRHLFTVLESYCLLVFWRAIACWLTS